MASKLTARGTVRLTPQQRSQKMKLVWRKRRKALGLPPLPPGKKKAPNPVRSKAIKASYRRRWRDGSLVKVPKKRRLTDAERSAIALAAVETRRQRRLEKEAILAKEARKQRRLENEAKVYKDTRRQTLRRKRRRGRAVDGSTGGLSAGSQ